MKVSWERNKPARVLTEFARRNKHSTIWFNKYPGCGQ